MCACFPKENFHYFPAPGRLDMRKITSFFVLVAFVLTCIMPPQGFAQTISAIGLMPSPGTQAGLSPVFTPAHLKGMVINPNDPFKFDFLIYRGDAPLTQDQKKDEYARLIKYFLASLAVPDTDQWVNLSPYEKDRIIPDNLGLTAMGRDLLAQDYLLKQISASLTNPDTDLGKKFWDGVYAQAYQKFGTTAIPTDTFNKVWITPDKAVVYEKGNSVVVLEHHLKVMLEKDYLATRESKEGAVTGEDNETAAISHKVMRAVIIPAIEKEVNEGKNFAPLRQVYSGMLLASWYKLALKESILGKLYADKSKVKGIDQDPKNNQEIYSQYVQAFRKGVFNMIKEDADHYTQEVIPRKYFSGGAVNNEKDVLQRLKGASGRADDAQGALEKVDLAEATLADASQMAFGNEKNIVQYDGVHIGTPAMLSVSRYYLLLKNMPAKGIWEDRNDGSIQIEEIYSNKILHDAKRLGLSVKAGYLKFEHVVQVYAEERALVIKVKDSLSPTGSLKYTLNNAGITKEVDNSELTVADAKSFIETTNSIWVIKPQEVKDVNPRVSQTITKLLKRHFPLETQGVESRFSGIRYEDTIRRIMNRISWKIKGTPKDSKILVELAVEEGDYPLGSDFAQGMKSADNSQTRSLADDLKAGWKKDHPQGPDRTNLYDLWRGRQVEKSIVPENYKRDSLLSGDVKKTNNADERRPGHEFVYAPENEDSDTLNLGLVVVAAVWLTGGESDQDNAENIKGGIDFARSNLSLQIKRDGAGVPLPVGQQDLDSIHINGLVPVILNIRPAAGVPLFSEAGTAHLQAA